MRSHVSRFRASMSRLTMLTIVNVVLLLSGSHQALGQSVPEEERSPFFEGERSARLGSCQWFTEEDDLTYLPTDPEEVRIKERLDLTLEETIDCGFFGTRELQEAYIELQIAQEEWRQARADYIPDVRLAAIPRISGTRIGGRSGTVVTYDIFDNELTDNSSSSSSSDTLAVLGAVQLEHTILAFGRRSAKLKAAEAAVRIAELNIGVQAENLQLALTRLYHNVQESDERVRIRQEAVVEAEKILAAAQGDLDVARAANLLANNQQRLSNSIDFQRTRRRRLATVLSLEDAESIGAVEPIVADEAWPHSLEESIVWAYENRAELEIVMAEQEIHIQDRRRELAELRPKLDISLGYGGGFTFDNFELNLNDEPTGFLTFRWDPLDFGGGRRARIAALSRESELEEVRFAEEREQIRFEVESAYFDLESRAYNIEIANQAIERAIDVLKLTRSRVGNGQITQIDVLQANNDLTRSRINLVSAVLGYNRALAELKRAVGGQGQYPDLLPEFDSGDLELLEESSPSYSEFGSELDPELEPDAYPVFDSDTEIEPEFGTETDAEPELYLEEMPESDAGRESGLESDADSELGAESNAGIEVEAGLILVEAEAERVSTVDAEVQFKAAALLNPIDPSSP